MLLKYLAMVDFYEAELKIIFDRGSLTFLFLCQQQRIKSELIAALF